MKDEVPKRTFPRDWSAQGSTQKWGTESGQGTSGGEQQAAQDEVTATRKRQPTSSKQIYFFL